MRACLTRDTRTRPRKETAVSIREIRELLIAEGERRQRLGQSALTRQPEDRSSRLDDSQAPDGEPKALEEG
jgi:hypothetical protein